MSEFVQFCSRGLMLLECDGERLRRDREALGLTREALVELGRDGNAQAFSVSSLRRAEKGAASYTKLALIAKRLGLPPSRYLRGNQTQLPRFSLEGTWHAFYAEKIDGNPPYTVVEVLHIHQNNNHIEGTYTPIESSHPDYLGERSFHMRGKIYDDFVLGQYETDDDSSQGTGYYILKAIRNWDWCEGFCTFYSDDATIASSLNIWIRRSSSEFQLMKKQAFNKIRQNMQKMFLIAPIVSGSVSTSDT
ncbi:MAG: helix-turn-helix transcriptional regulator [Parasphingopyxis sp.]|uniref:helix-turn-helix domain-containing protein n=1 Tax=Parasphingopyxis sp. TaxID=1920299 RepID=UPI0032ECD9AB